MADIQPPPAPKDLRDHDLEVGLIYTYEQDLISRLIWSIDASTANLRRRLILVDNASQESVEPWAKLIPDTRVLRNTHRLHYAANLNRILATASARYVLLLNTDIYFDPRQQCLARMVEFMDQHPDCGISGCRILHLDGHDAWPARRFQTLSIILARRLGLASLLRGTIDRYFYREHDPKESFACDWLSGCFLLMRREAFEQVGFFDESFVKYFEDVDMCLRMARAGWRVMYHGDTSCYHLEQRASMNPLSSDAWKHLRSYVYWLRKWGYAPSSVVGSPHPHAA
jgi:N-acetylglucosaminyl-diphospho-decaprenol L-rhamnosyltransferase